MLLWILLFIVFVSYLVTKFGSIFRGTPAIIFASTTDVLYALWSTFSFQNEQEYLLIEKQANSQLAKVLGVKEDSVLIGVSCRTVFDNFLSVCKELTPSKTRVLATPMMHTSFPKAVTFNALTMDLMDVDLRTFQFAFDETKYDPSLYLAVVITHAFGRAFETDAIVNWAKANQIPVFEDAVQAQMFPLYKGNPKTDIVGYSGGLDKIPASFGCGPALVRNPTIRSALVAKLNQLPHQSHFFRFKKLVESSFLFIAYCCVPLTAIVTSILPLLGLKVHQLAMAVRKNASGFIHDRDLYMKRPSLAGIKSILNALTKDWTVNHKIMSQQFKVLRKNINENVRKLSFPWIKNFDTIEDSCFYFHLYTEEPVKMMEFLDSKGYIIIPQQSWYDPGDNAPGAKEISKKNDHSSITI